MRRSTKNNEVAFAFHTLEFKRFYEKQKLICDYISGIQYVDKNDKREKIYTEDLKEGLYFLTSFIMDNIHYLQEDIWIDYIVDSLDKLKEDYENNKQFHVLQEKKKNNNLMFEETQNYLDDYLGYLKKCFTLLYETAEHLQRSIFISPKNELRQIGFRDDHEFFKGLADYRDEISYEMARFNYSKIVLHYKKIMGYFYTYKCLIGKRRQAMIDRLLDSLKDYILDSKKLKLIMKYTQKQTNASESEIIQEDAKIIVKLIFKCYFLINLALSDKKILPKGRDYVLIDVTGV